MKNIGSILFALSLTLVGADEWTQLAKVTHDRAGYTDGDSIPVTMGEESFIINLYFIDAPEVSARFPDKANEQAEYFGQSVEDVTLAGKKAGEFVETMLTGDFTVHTRYSKIAGGGGPRYYGMIKVGDRWLSELLVENGWARVAGRGSDLSDGTTEDAFHAALGRLETRAAQNKIGAWSEHIADEPIPAAAPVPAAEESTATLTGVHTLEKEIVAYSADGEFKPMGKLKEGWKIKIVDGEPYVRVIVAVPGKGTMPVLIKAGDLK